MLLCEKKTRGKNIKNIKKERENSDGRTGQVKKGGLDKEIKKKM